MAKSKKVKVQSKLHMYLIAHVRAALASLGKLVSAPFASFFTIAVIAIALTLPAVFYVLLNNAEGLAQGVTSASSKVSIYLKTDLSKTQIDDFLHQMRSNPEIANLQYISPAAGLKQFSQTLDTNKVLSLLNFNPLPGVIIIQPVLSMRGSVKLQQLVFSLKQLPEVDTVQFNMEWLQKVQSILGLWHQIVFLLGLILGAGVLLIVGNTLRLEMQSERQEIAVYKLVGATNAFIRRPFLYIGIWYGCIGGLIACVLVQLFVAHLENAIGNLVVAYNSDFYLSGLTAGQMFLITLFCMLLSYAGSWLSINRTLKTIH